MRGGDRRLSSFFRAFIPREDIWISRRFALYLRRSKPFCTQREYLVFVIVIILVSFAIASLRISSFAPSYVAARRKHARFSLTARANLVKGMA